MRSARVSMIELRVYVGLARQLAAVAPSRLGAILNSVAILRVWVAEHGSKPLPRPILVRISYLGQRFDFQAANRSELQVIKEMFLEKQYAIGGIEPKLIVDLGSNIGASIAFFRATYPDAQIIGVEPGPGAFDRMRLMVQRVPGVRVYPWAIADRTGRLTFRQTDQSWESALVSEADADTIEVETVTLPDLLDRLGVERVDLLKLDVEGAEWLMFNQPSTFDACETIIGELHLERPDQTTERAEEALSGFTVSITSRMVARANFIARRG